MKIFLTVRALDSIRAEGLYNSEKFRMISDALQLVAQDRLSQKESQNARRIPGTSENIEVASIGDFRVFFTINDEKLVILDITKANPTVSWTRYDKAA